MSEEFDEEFIFFRPLTPEELLQTKNQQTVLTPQEKFARIQKQFDKRARRLRKYHFTAVETTNLLYVFDGEGEEVIQVENSVKGCRLAREICLQIFLTSDNQNGGYSFSGPRFDNLSDEEIEQSILSTYKHIEFHRFSNEEIDSGEYDMREPINSVWCGECEFGFKTKTDLAKHVCTDQFVLYDASVYKLNFAMENRSKTWMLFA